MIKIVGYLIILIASAMIGFGVSDKYRNIMVVGDDDQSISRLRLKLFEMRLTSTTDCLVTHY